MALMQQTHSIALTVTVIVLAVLISVVGATHVEATNEKPQPFPAETKAKLETALEHSRKALKIPGINISLYIPGEGFWETSSGVEDKATQKPMVAGVHTRIGSITKTFTVTAILLLADDKLLKLDDPISKYLDFVPNGNDITLRQMANMTSGLFSYTKDDTWVEGLISNPHRAYTARQLVDAGLNHKPSPYSFTPPGSSIDYSNTNTVLLGMVIEKVSKMTLKQFFESRIFNPLGMKNTSWPTNTEMPTPFAHGYTVQTPTGAEADATFFDPSWGHAAGQLISNLEDLKKWTVALGEGTLISSEMQKERLKWAPYGSPTFRYGGGIGYFNGWIGHTGSLPGYNTGVYYLPAKKAVLVIQTNTDIPFKSGTPPVSTEPVNGVFRSIAKIVTPNNIPDGNDFTDDDLPD